MNNKNKTINKQILRIALPSIISNITVPLLGLIDVAIVGHLGDAAYIGAIAVGGLIFSIIYSLFGFLRMGTSGMTSQALGKRDLQEVSNVLYRSLFTGLIVAAALLLLQYPIEFFTLNYIIQSSASVQTFASQYFYICIWGAPAMLTLYSLTGWFIGMQNSKIPMYIAITQNIINIIASLALVYFFDMKVEGIALGTVIAQYGGLIMGITLWLKFYKKLLKYKLKKESFDKSAMLKFFNVNKHIFLRTLCLITVTLFFTSTGAKQGEVILAVNTLLMQLFTLFSYIMDGFAYAGEALTGKLMGARNFQQLRKTILQLFKWGIALALSFTLLYAIGGDRFLGLLTDNKEVIEATDQYYLWAIAIPIAGFSAFLWDGIFIGTTLTKLMLYTMLGASLLFFIVFYLFESTMGNHALWLAFICYLSSRGFIQALLFKQRINVKTDKNNIEIK